MGGAYDDGHPGFVMGRLSTESCIYHGKAENGGRTDTTVNNSAIHLIRTTRTAIPLWFAVNATATTTGVQNAGRSTPRMKAFDMDHAVS